MSVASPFDLALFSPGESLNRLIALKRQGWHEHHVLPNTQFSPILDRNLAVASHYIRQHHGDSYDNQLHQIKSYADSLRVGQQMSIWRYTFIHQALVCLLSDREWGQNPWFMDFQRFEHEVHPVLLKRSKALYDPECTDLFDQESGKIAEQYCVHVDDSVPHVQSKIQYWQHLLFTPLPAVNGSGIFSKYMILKAWRYRIHPIGTPLGICSFDGEEDKEPSDLWGHDVQDHTEDFSTKTQAEDLWGSAFDRAYDAIQSFPRKVIRVMEEVLFEDAHEGQDQVSRQLGSYVEGYAGKKEFSAMTQWINATGLVVRDAETYDEVKALYIRAESILTELYEGTFSRSPADLERYIFEGRQKRLRSSSDTVKQEAPQQPCLTENGTSGHWQDGTFCPD